MESAKTDQAFSLLKQARARLAHDEAQDAAALAEQALDLFREVGSESGKREALDVVVQARLLASGVDAALAAARDAAAACERAGDSKGQAAALRAVVELLTNQGSFQDAAAAAGELAELFRRLSDASGLVAALAALAAARSPKGAGAEGRRAGAEALREWLAKAKGLSDRRAEACASHALACALLRPGAGAAADGEARWEEARKLGACAAQLYAELQESAPHRALLETLLRLAAEAKDDAEVAARGKELVQLCRSSGDEVALRGALLTRASAQLELGSVAKAEATLLEAIDAARNAKAGRDEAEASCLMAKVHSEMGRHDEAFDAISSAGSLGRSLDDRRAAGAALTLAARAALEALGAAERALELAEEATEAFGAAGDARGQAELFVGVVVSVHQQLRQPAKAVHAAEAAIELFRALGDRAAEAEALRTLVRVHQEDGNFEDAVEVARETVEVCERNGLKTTEVEARHLLAEMQHATQSDQRALETAAGAVALCQRLGNRVEEAKIMETVIRIHLACERFDTALDTAGELRALCSSSGDLARAAKAATTIANIRIRQGAFKEVAKSAKVAQQACHDSGDAHGEARQYLALACARQEQLRLAMEAADTAEAMAAALPPRRLMEGLMAAKEALHLFRMVGDGDGEAATQQELSRIHLLKQEPVLAAEAAATSAAIYRAMSNLHGTANSLLLEAAAHLAVSERSGGLPVEGEDEVSREKQALAAAEEASKLAEGFIDELLHRQCANALESARARLGMSPSAAAPGQRRARRPRALVAIDESDRAPLEDMGFRFKSSEVAAQLVRSDPRDEAVFGRSMGFAPSPRTPSIAQPSPAMGRLLGAAARFPAAKR